jgi:hypothetical protein
MLPAGTNSFQELPVQRQPVTMQTTQSATLKEQQQYLASEQTLPHPCSPKSVYLPNEAVHHTRLTDAGKQPLSKQTLNTPSFLMILLIRQLAHEFPRYAHSYGSLQSNMNRQN